MFHRLSTPKLPAAAPSIESKGQHNIALAALLQLGNPKACVDLLVKTDRVPEAALFARTYAPRFVFVSLLLIKSPLCGLGSGLCLGKFPEDHPRVLHEMRSVSQSGWICRARQSVPALVSPCCRHRVCQAHPAFGGTLALLGSLFGSGHSWGSICGVLRT